MDGLCGLRGWQWLFIIEALPALLLSVIVFFYLTDRPADAKWLPPEGRAWLAQRLDDEHRQRVAAQHFSVLEALGNTRVLLLSFVYFGAVAANYSLGFFLPQIVRESRALDAAKADAERTSYETLAAAGPELLRALALRDLAEAVAGVDSLTVTPDLVTGLLGRVLPAGREAS